MKRIVNFRPINIFTLETKSWEYGYHKHNFYELILIENGTGIHHRNNLHFNYKKGDIFLLTPSDAHEFIISDETKFIYIKYTEQYLSELLVNYGNQGWRNALRGLLTISQISEGSIINEPEESAKIFTTAKLLLSEFNSKKPYTNETIQALFSTILSIIVRNMNQSSNDNRWLTFNGEKIDQILSYINIYALDKERMRIESLAEQFSMSANYISIFVKKNSDLSIQHHIMAYKMKVAEKLLKENQYNINEIAIKLGFNDAGHFNKFFKKYFNTTPSNYRKDMKIGEIT